MIRKKHLDCQFSFNNLTFGIYSAWAKVRTTNYFYGNTKLKETRPFNRKPYFNSEGSYHCLYIYGESNLRNFIQNTCFDF